MNILKRAVAGFVADHIFRGKRVLAEGAQVPPQPVPAWILHEIGAADYVSSLLPRVPYDQLRPYLPHFVLTLTGYHRRRVEHLVQHALAGTTPRVLLPNVPRTFTGQQVLAYRLQHEPWLMSVEDLHATWQCGGAHGLVELNESAIDIVAHLLLGMQSTPGRSGGDQ